MSEEAPKKKRQVNSTLSTVGVLFTTDAVVLAVLGSIGKPSNPQKVFELMGAGAHFTLARANVHRHVRQLCIDGYISAKLAEKGRPIIYYSLTESGREWLRAERTKALHYADLIDQAVPP